MRISPTLSTIHAACTRSFFDSSSRVREPGNEPSHSLRATSHDRSARAATASRTSSSVGNVLSSDTFYNANPTFNEAWQRMGVLAVEMETAGLYATAAHAGVEALGVFTVSDSLVTGEATDAQARQTSFTTMMELALPLATL